jgi:hypothetical protein
MMDYNQAIGGHVAVVPNNLAGLASLGFSLAGGMSLIAAALSSDRATSAED